MRMEVERLKRVAHEAKVRRRQHAMSSEDRRDVPARRRIMMDAKKASQRDEIGEMYLTAKADSEYRIAQLRMQLAKHCKEDPDMSP